jgi:hypothetical protein
VDKETVAQSAMLPWIDGVRRHLDDLREDSYEGVTGPEREARYRTAFDLLSPIARDVLAELNTSLLRGTGEVSIQTPVPDGHSGLIGSWTLNWPELQKARNRISGKALRPVTISAVFLAGFTHPHLAAGDLVDPRAESLMAWPMQVTTEADAAGQQPLLWAIAIAELHDRVYQSSWRIIPG